MGIDLKPIEFEQPQSFEFDAERKAQARKIIARYPDGRQASAVIPLLFLAQQQHDGWVPQAAIDYLAMVLAMPPMKVKEVASFYTMFNLQPVGTYHLQICGTTPCALRGSQAILDACEMHLGIQKGETTADGKFTLTEVECLGACVNAPVLELTTTEVDTYYEDLTPHIAQEIIDRLAKGEMPQSGSQSGRHSSEPQTGPTTLSQANDNEK